MRGRMDGWLVSGEWKTSLAPSGIDGGGGIMNARRQYEWEKMHILDSVQVLHKDAGGKFGYPPSVPS